MNDMTAVAAYGVRLLDPSVPSDLPRHPSLDSSAWELWGQVDGERHAFVVCYAASTAPGSAVVFEPVIPRRHLWDAELELLADRYGWRATAPAWMLFFEADR